MEDSEMTVDTKDGIMYLDPCWFEVFNGAPEDVSLPYKAWVSFKAKGAKGVHGFIRYLGERYEPESLSPDFRVLSWNGYSITLGYGSPTETFRFVGPENVMSSIHDKNVISLDVGLGGLGVSIGTTGKSDVIRIWESSTGIIRRELPGHKGFGYTCRFFPSGIVILTGGADTQLEIWSAETGKSHRTFKGHTAAIVDTAIVDRGRNIISVSKDASVRLWNCGSGSYTELISQLEDIPTCCQIMDFDFNDSFENQVVSSEEDLESGTENKLLVLGCENGSVIGINIRQRSQVFRCKIDSDIKALALHSKDSQIFVGCGNGSLHRYKIICKNDSYSLELGRVWNDSLSAVESLLYESDGVFVGRRDGSCIWYSEESLKISLLGADVDPVYSISKDRSAVYTGARDGKIRRYLLKHIFRSS